MCLVQGEIGNNHSLAKLMKRSIKSLKKEKIIGENVNYQSQGFHMYSLEQANLQAICLMCLRLHRLNRRTLDMPCECDVNMCDGNGDDLNVKFKCSTYIGKCIEQIIHWYAWFGGVIHPHLFTRRKNDDQKIIFKCETNKANQTNSSHYQPSIMVLDQEWIPHLQTN